MSGSRSIERAEREVRSGRIWRAKEILRSASARVPADAALLERYGQLLDEVGDRFEAGRCLYASGAREPAYAAAIEVFLSRLSRATPQQFLSELPSAVRAMPFTALPPTLQEDLRRRGVPDRFPQPVRSHPPVVANWRDKATAAAGCAIALLFIAALIVGVVTILDWVLDRFR